MFVSRYGWLLTPVLGLVMAALPADETAPSAASGDLERNRQLLQQWKADPEHYARLRRDLRAYWALPRARRQGLRQLDKQLHELDAATQRRLWRVAQRYRVWLEKLPEGQRREIETASDWHERLARIQAIRQSQWIERLPRRVRDELDNLPAAERKTRIAQLREQEQRQRKLWQRPVAPGPRPVKPRNPN